MDGPGLEEVVDALDAGEAELRSLIGELLREPELMWRFVAVNGVPGVEVESLVREVEADLVVVGSNRRQVDPQRSPRLHLRVSRLALTRRRTRRAAARRRD